LVPAAIVPLVVPSITAATPMVVVVVG